VPVGPLALVILLIFGAIAGYMLISTLRAVDGAGAVLPKLTTTLSSIERNTRVSKLTGQMERATRQILAESKPIVPVLQKLNTHSAELDDTMSSILETTKSTEAKAAETQELITSMQALVVSTGATVDQLDKHSKAVLDTLKGTVKPGHRTLRSVLESEPSVGSLTMQMDSITKDLKVIGDAIAKGLKKLKPVIIRKLIRAYIKQLVKRLKQHCERNPAVCAKAISALVKRCAGNPSCRMAAAEEISRYCKAHTPACREAVGRFCQKNPHSCVGVAAACARDPACAQALETAIGAYCEKNSAKCLQGVETWCKDNNQQCTAVAERCASDPSCQAGVDKACSGPKNKIACLMLSRKLCKDDPSLPFCSKRGPAGPSPRRRT
jgi:hypothetical protein